MFHRDNRRRYYRCRQCGLVFIPPEQHLSAEDEKTRYDLHSNSSDDSGYRLFLSRLFAPLHERLKPGSCGLDFGSGPGPTLSVLFQEAGHTMKLYDHFYAPDSTVLNAHYDFITASEVVEHLHNPRMVLEKLWGCLKPQGYLGIMTKLVKNRDAFAGWHYIHDPTHVCFFSRETFSWLAEAWQAKLTFIGSDVMIFHKETIN